jgi:hypothetical protein
LNVLRIIVRGNGVELMGDETKATNDVAWVSRESATSRLELVGTRATSSSTPSSSIVHFSRLSSILRIGWMT